MNTKTFFFIFSTLFLVQLTTATCSDVNVVTSTAVSTATTGTNVVISGTATSPTPCVDDVSFVSVGKNTWYSLTVIDPPSGIYLATPISPSGTTRTFTVTSEVADAYDYNVRVGTQLSKPTGLLTYINARDMIVQGSPETITVSQGDVFTYSVNITNPTNDTVTTFYEVSYPSQYFSLSGDLISATISIPAGSSSRLMWDVTVLSTDFETTDITFQLGDNRNAFTSKILRENPLRPKPIELPCHQLCLRTVNAEEEISKLRLEIEDLKQEQLRQKSVLNQIFDFLKVY